MNQVAVIIPAFNRGHVLVRALDSVLAQTFEDWEMVIVDDGSTDGTETMVRKWLEHKRPTQNIQFVKLANGGVSRARNVGVGLTAAPWLAFLDSDDEWLPEKLALQMELTPHNSLIHTGEIWIRNGVRVNAMKKHAKTGGRVFVACVEQCFISPSTTLLARELFVAHGGFREDLTVCEDYDLWLKITAETSIGFIETPLIKKYGGDPDQLSLSTPAMDYYRVKALKGQLHNRFLSEEEKRVCAESLIQRAEILLKGFKKYPNASREREVQEAVQSARNALTTNQNTHSAAESFPRSEFNDTL